MSASDKKKHLRKAGRNYSSPVTDMIVTLASHRNRHHVIAETGKPVCITLRY